MIVSYQEARIGGRHFVAVAGWWLQNNQGIWVSASLVLSLQSLLLAQVLKL